MSAPLSLSPASRILVRGVNWLGDAVMSTPALDRLREAYPRAHLALLTTGKLAPLYQHHSALNQIIELAGSVWATGRRLNAEQFDAALILPNSFRSALEPFLARIPSRIGYPGNGRGLLLTRSWPRLESFRPMVKKSPRQVRRLIQEPTPLTDPTPAPAHHLHHYLHLAAALGASVMPCPPRLMVTEEETARFRKDFGVPAGKLLLGLCPGAEYGPAKRWPLNRFAAVIAAINKIAPCEWMLFGTDQTLSAALLSALEPLGASPSGVRDLTGRTSLRQLLAGLRMCRIVLTNDSGPMHAAAALGIPVIVPFGSTDPLLTGPGLPGSPGHSILQVRVPCAPCFLRACPIDHRCMTGIAVADVVAAVTERLRAINPSEDLLR